MGKCFLAWAMAGSLGLGGSSSGLGGSGGRAASGGVTSATGGSTFLAAGSFGWAGSGGVAGSSHRGGVAGLSTVPIPVRARAIAFAPDGRVGWVWLAAALCMARIVLGSQRGECPRGIVALKGK